jgi:hypothetical protein
MKCQIAKDEIEELTEKKTLPKLIRKSSIRGVDRATCSAPSRKIYHTSSKQTRNNEIKVK